MVGFATLSRMVRAFFEHWHAHGCWSWDVVIAKCLSVVLVASLGCRSSDVARALGYVGLEYMQWRHIDLYCEGKATYRNLRAVVTVEFPKGEKDVLNEEFVYYLRPLDDVDCQHVCPIALILTHTLRNGLVFGSTVQEVLDHAAATLGLRVAWKFPDLSVLTAIARKPSRCDLTKVTAPKQLLNTIKEMGLITNILTRVYMHATRLGAAREVAHLPKSAEGFSFTTDEVAQSLGHKRTTLGKGITEAYVGGSTREFYNDRAMNKFRSHRREPKFGIGSAYDVVKAAITEEEIRDWKEKNKDTKLNRQAIQERIRSERHLQYMQTAVRETTLASKSTANPAILATMSSSQINISQSAHSRTRHLKDKQSTLSIIDSLTDIETPSQSNISQSTHSRTWHPNDKQSTPSIVASLTDTETRRVDALSGVDYTNYDPALLDDEFLEQLEVHPGDLNLLRAAIFPTESTTMASTEEEMIDQTGSEASDANERMLFEESTQLLLGHENQQTTLTPEEWIDRYARINIVHNTAFGCQWLAYSQRGQAFKSTIGDYAAKGNSRDEPTPFIFYCHKTEGCTYQGLTRGRLVQHHLHCNDVVEKAAGESGTERLPCTNEGCQFSFANKWSLREHVREYHEWLPKPCEHGCDPSTLYQTGYTYSRHQQNQQSGRWPSTCRYPECDKVLSSAVMAKYHLDKVHGVTDGTEQLEYLPPLPSKTKWVQQTCVHDGCTQPNRWSSRKDLVKNLKAIHHLTDVDANELVDERAQLIT